MQDIQESYTTSRGLGIFFSSILIDEGSTSQDANHSGAPATPVSDSSTPAQESGDCNVLEDEGRQGQKPKVLWPAAKQIKLDFFFFF